MNVCATEQATEAPIMHWGKAVWKNEPVTGVLYANKIDSEAFNDLDQKSIDLQWEEYLAECEKNNVEPEDDWCDHNYTHVVGMEKDEEGLYVPDKTEDYSIIMAGDPITLQVVHSIYVQRCALCSPCFPGQGNLNSEGEFLAYSLPSEMFNPDYNTVPEVYVWDLEKEYENVSKFIDQVKNMQHNVEQMHPGNEDYIKGIKASKMRAYEYLVKILEALVNENVLTVRQQHLTWW